MAKIPVELWSTDPDAIEASSATFQQMGCVGIVKEGETYYIDTGTANEGFIRFAAEQQGYIQRVVAQVKSLLAQAEEEFEAMLLPGGEDTKP